MRSRVAGAGKGRRTSDSGVVPAGIVAAGVVPPGVVPTDILRISPRSCGPSSPRQPRRGRRREPGERIPPRRDFRVGTWAAQGEGRGGARAAAGLLGGERPPQERFENSARDRLVPFSKNESKKGGKKKGNLNELVCGEVSNASIASSQ